MDNKSILVLFFVFIVVFILSFTLSLDAVANNNKFWEAMNYEHVGGTPVLGVGAPVIIGHGCSSPLAIRSMILSTEHTAKAGLTEKLRLAFND